MIAIPCMANKTPRTPPRLHWLKLIIYNELSVGLSLHLQDACNPVTQPLHNSTHPNDCSASANIVVVFKSHLCLRNLAQHRSKYTQVGKIRNQEGHMSPYRSILFYFSMAVSIPAPQAPPSVEFADASPSQNYASVAPVSTKSSLFRLKSSTSEAYPGLYSFANSQAWLVQLF